MHEPVHGKGEFKCRLFSSLPWLYISLVLLVFLCTSSFKKSGLHLLGYLVYMFAVFVLSRLVDNSQVPMVLLISQPSWFFAYPKETLIWGLGTIVALACRRDLCLPADNAPENRSLLNSVEFLLSPISVRRWEQPIVGILWTQVILIHTSCFHD